MAWGHLPTRVHYALKALCCLAEAKGPVRARELAYCGGIPPTQAAKILYLLTWAGFASSRRGSKGGFWLRVPCEQILIRDVIRFFHPPGDGRAIDSDDPVLHAWQRIADSTHRSFEQLTLATLMTKGKAASAYEDLFGPERRLPPCP